MTAYEMRISDWSSDVCSSDLVVDDQRVLAAVAEVLAHGATRVRGDVLHRGRLRRRRGDHRGVGHRAVLLELAHDVGDGRVLLADSGVDRSEERRVGNGGVRRWRPWYALAPYKKNKKK